MPDTHTPSPGKQGFLLAWSCDAAVSSLATLMKYLPRLMLKSPPEFRNVGLQVDLPEAATRERVLGAHCQCGNKAKALASKVQGARASIKLGRRRVKVPLWVAFSCNAAEGSTDVPRHQKMPQLRPGQAKAGMFRTGGRGGQHGSRCQIPAAVFHNLGKILEGLRAGRSFADSLLQELGQVYSTVGVRTEMRCLLDSMAVCWNWAKLVSERPERAEVEAFLSAQKTLHPFLKHTLWPDGETHPVVRKDWKLSDRELAKQYLLLCARVRRVSKAASQNPDASAETYPQVLLQEARSWQKVFSFMVQPVWTFTFVERALSYKFGSSAPNASVVRIVAANISLCLGKLFDSSLPAKAWTEIEVRPNAVRFVSWPFWQSVAFS